MSEKWYPLNFVWRKFAWDLWNPSTFFYNLSGIITLEEKKRLWIQAIVDEVNREGAKNPNFLRWSYGELRALELITEVYNF
jgi:hypothetical protein